MLYADGAGSPAYVGKLLMNEDSLRNSVDKVSNHFGGILSSYPPSVATTGKEDLQLEVCNFALRLQ